MWRGTTRITGTPAEATGYEGIAQGARLISGLTSLVRFGPGADPRLKTDGDGRIDLRATAFSFGVTPAAMEDRILDRRRQTARAAYLMFGLGVVFLALWIYSALHMRLTSARVLSAVEFLPFGLLFFLLSFKSALMNWQLRTLRLGSAAAYMQTTEPFLPS